MKTEQTGRSSRRWFVAAVLVLGMLVSVGLVTAAEPALPSLGQKWYAAKAFAPIIAAVQTPEIVDMGDMFDLDEEFAGATLPIGKVHRWTVELFEDESVVVSAIAPAPADIVLTLAQGGIPLIDRQNDAGPGEAETIRSPQENRPRVYEILVETAGRIRTEYAIVAVIEGDFAVQFSGFVEGGLPLEDIVMAPDESHYWFYLAEKGDKLAMTLTPDADSDIVGDLYGPGAEFLDVLDEGWDGEVEQVQDFPLEAGGMHAIRVSDLEYDGMTYSLLMDLE